MLKAAAAAGYLDERSRGARGADLDPPRRGRHHHHLPRQGRRPMAAMRRSGTTDGIQDGPAAAAARAQAAQPQGGRRDRARRPRQAPAEPDAGPVPDRPASLPARRRGGRDHRGGGDGRASARLLDERIIRQVTPIFDTRALGYSSMLVAAKVDPENPWRAANVINAHPGVSHNYLRNHEFNIWFTIATEPDSQLGLRGHARRAGARGRGRVGPPAADAQAVQDPDGPGDGGRHRRAGQGGGGRRAGRDRAPSPTTSSTGP